MKDIRAQNGPGENIITMNLDMLFPYAIAALIHGALWTSLDESIDTDGTIRQDVYWSVFGAMVVGKIIYIVVHRLDHETHKENALTSFFDVFFAFVTPLTLEVALMSTIYANVDTGFERGLIAWAACILSACVAALYIMRHRHDHLAKRETMLTSFTDLLLITTSAAFLEGATDITIKEAIDTDHIKVMVKWIIFVAVVATYAIYYRSHRAIHVHGREDSVSHFFDIIYPILFGIYLDDAITGTLKTYVTNKIALALTETGILLCLVGGSLLYMYKHRFEHGTDKETILTSFLDLAFPFTIGTMFEATVLTVVSINTEHDFDLEMGILWGAVGLLIILYSIFVGCHFKAHQTIPYMNVVDSIDVKRDVIEL